MVRRLRQLAELLDPLLLALSIDVVERGRALLVLVFTVLRPQPTPPLPLSVSTHIHHPVHGLG